MSRSLVSRLSSSSRHRPPSLIADSSDSLDGCGLADPPILIALLVVVFFGLTATPSLAGTAEEINALPVLDSLSRSEGTLSNSGKWSALAWDTSTSGHNTGQDTTSGWGPYDAFSTVNGAYWNPSTFNDKTGNAAAITMQTGPGGAERYVALWLDMATPSSAKSGYQLRWTVVSGTTYSVALSRFSAGTQTVLAANASVTIPTGTTLAISDTGGTVTAWMGAGGTLSSLLSAADTSYSSGYAGIEGSGNISRSTNFKAGNLLGDAIFGSPVLDNLERSEVPLATGKWSKSSWAGEIGGAWMGGYRGYGSSGGLAGAWWNPTTFSDAQGGDLVAGTVGTGAPNAGEYMGLWLNMPSPGSARSGYEARFTGINGSASNYKVELSKWVAGTRTVLTSKEGFSLAAGTTIGLTDTGGTVSLSTGTSAMTPLLTANDSTFASGYAGLEVNGIAGTIYNFRAGGVGQPPDTTISSGPKGVVVPNVSFGFTSTEAGSSFECSLDAAAYGACTSPNGYQGLSEGSHIFRVRAKGSTGSDETPAERSFQVLTAAKATTKTPLLDNLERSEIHLATGKWSKSSWAGEIGGAWMGGYRGYGSNGGLAGAWWNPTIFNDSEGTVLVVGTVGTGSPWEGEYLALWLNMPSPGSARSGYEARFTGFASSYKVELSKWVSGTRTVLASTSGFSLPVDTTMALTETSGGSLGLWTGTSTLSPVLTASDATYTSGYAGLEVNGVAGTIYNFRAGNIDNQAPNTTITSGPNGSVLPEAVSFAFTSTESGSVFECSLDAAAYSACTSPKAYPTISQGAHVFKVHAVDVAGNQDETPAERSFSVIKPPDASTGQASGVSSTQATLNASVNPNGAETTYQFEYGTTTGYGTKVPVSAKAIGSGASNVDVNESLIGLTPDTTYHFRISATSGSGTTKGEDRTFTTTTVPVVTAEPASELSANEATLNALINPKGAATTYQFEYGPTTAYGSKAPATPQGIGSAPTPVPVSATVSGLTEGTTYHYRVVATNSVGKTNSADQLFTTLFLPDATTESAIAVDTDDAVLTGSIDANGSPTTYQFEYGQTNAYGSIVPGAVEVIETGNGAEEAEEVASSLQPNTTYHYRLKATSEAGTVVGADHIFTTTATNVSPPDPAEEVTQPPDFVNLQWSADHQRDAEEYSMRVIANSGAKMLRLGFIGSTTQATYDQIFRLAAEKGVRILPQWGGGHVPTAGTEQEARVAELASWVARYGSEGTFWKEFTVPYLPPTHWEIWNEPNVAKNAMPNNTIDPAEFGRFLQQAAGAVRTDPKAQVIVGGLLTVSKAAGDEAHVTPSQFIRKMEAEGAYDAVALHPYVFKATDDQAPNTDPEVENVAGRVRNHIYNLRAAMNGSEVVNGAVKRIWVTELGWPVENPQAEKDKLGTKPNTHPAVTESIQRDLLRESIKEIKKSRQELKIRALFYYDIQDLVRGDTETWEYRAGLRTHDGRFRPAWHAFRLAADQPISWPATPAAVTEGATPLARSGTLFGKVNAGGAPTSYRFQWERPDATPEEFDNSTNWDSAGTGESAIMQSREISSLLPSTEYRYRIVAENVNGDVSKGASRQFTTEPMSNTTGTFSSLNGEPGWVNVAGWSKYDGVGLHGYTVRINFVKTDGTYVYQDVTLNNGQYRLDNFALGRGTWTAWATFLAQGGYPESKTPGFHTFTIKNGYRLIAKHSNKCLDVYQGQLGEGASLIQYDCAPQASLNQVFKLVPMDNQSNYQIVARHSNRCVGVTAGSQAPGQQLSQSTCLGSAWPHQIWKGEAMLPNGDDNSYNRFIAQHSGQCMEVLQSKTEVGAPVDQYPCGGTQANQLWTFESVDADQVPTQTFLTIEYNNTYHGMPGFVSFHGRLDIGERAYPLAGRKVHVQFYRPDGQGQYDEIPDSTVAVDVNAAGEYSYMYWSLGRDTWHAKAVFYGTADALGSSESGPHDVLINSGYRLMFRSTKKCLATQGNGTANDTHMVQYTCHTGSTPYDGQVFSLWPVAPVGANHWQLRPNTANNGPSGGQCVDVHGAQTENHAEINLYQCIGAANQTWAFPELLSQEDWFGAVAQHSNKCMDVPGGDPSEGLQIRQFECIWNGNQQFAWIVVP
jgi:hypothetical protein